MQINVFKMVKCVDVEVVKFMWVTVPTHKLILMDNTVNWAVFYLYVKIFINSM